MSENTLKEDDLTLTGAAQSKMVELFDQVEENIEGIRVYAMPGGCSGVNFGMTFTDTIDAVDGVLKCEGFNVIVDESTMAYLRGVEIDYLDRGDGNPSFVFNNLKPVAESGCGTCSSSSSQGGGCS